MAATASNVISISASATVRPAARARINRRRHITPQAGHALEILGHAIEYLTDEFVHEESAMSPRSGQLQAVQMLMALNRQVYFECPEVPTLGERCRTIFHLHAA
jgi:hypothetical protein